MVKASETGGVKPMTVIGRLNRERERIHGMSEEEKAFRKKFLKDQVLAHNEPKVVPELYRELNNPIRRFYKWPLDTLQKTVLEPMLGANRALTIRYLTGKALMGLVGVYAAAYYLKYNGNDWTRKRGWVVWRSRAAVVEGDLNYPQVSDKSKPQDYADQGFSKVKLNLGHILE